MNRPILLAAALALGGLVTPILTAAQSDALTTAYFEKHGVQPRNAGKLRATVIDQTLSIRALKSGVVERVYYGPGSQRVDSKGVKTQYHITESGIEEEAAGMLRMLLIYDWEGHAYVCLEEAGDLDELGAAAGSCPYEIVATTQGNHTQG